MRGNKENFYGYYSDLLTTAFSDGLGEVYNTEEGNFMFVGKVTGETTPPGTVPDKPEPTFLVLSTFRNSDSDLGYVGLVSNSESIFFRISVTYDYGNLTDDSFDDKPPVFKNRSLSLVRNGNIVDVLPGSEEEKLFREFLGLTKRTQPLENLDRFKEAVCMKNKIDESLIDRAGSS